MNNCFANVLYIAGTTLVIYACFKAWPPLGWLVSGLALLGCAGMLTRAIERAKVEQTKMAWPPAKDTGPSAKLAESEAKPRVVTMGRPDGNLN